MIRVVTLAILIVATALTGCGGRVPSTPGELHNAILADEMDAVSAALDARPNLLRMRGERGMLPLAVAAQAGNIPIAALLVGRGANVNEEKPHRTPLNSAVRYGRCDMAEWLVSQGVDVNAATVIGEETPLMGAAHRGDLKMVKLLIEHGANVNATNQTGSTALHYAAESSCHRVPSARYEEYGKANYARVVELLIDHGSDVNARKTYNNFTPLRVAENMGHRSMIDLLRSRGAKR